MTPPAPTRRLRTGSIVLLVIGAVLVIAGPILGVLAGSLAMIPGAFTVGNDTAAVQPEATISLDANQKLYLLAPVSQLAQITHDDCIAGTSDRDTDVVFAPATALNTLVDGTTYEAFASITATTSGDYTIACETMVPVVTAPPFDLAGIFGPFLWLTVAGILLGVVGIIFVIIGIVRVARR